MAKRQTGIGAKRKQLKSPHKTQKRLDAKRAMLAAKPTKRFKK